MSIVTPERWYMAFWVAMLVGLYLVIKWAIVAAKVEINRRGL